MPKKRIACIVGVHYFAQTDMRPLDPTDPTDPRMVAVYECLNCGTMRGEVR